MINIKSWFFDKKMAEIGQDRAYAVRCAIAGNEQYIKSESDKAVLIAYPSDWGTVTFWVPRSCIETEAETEARQQREAEQYRAKVEAQEAGLAQYEDLVARAKAAGLPVRMRMKARTIMQIAAERGVTL